MRVIALANCASKFPAAHAHARTSSQPVVVGVVSPSTSTPDGNTFRMSFLRAR